LATSKADVGAKTLGHRAQHGGVGILAVERCGGTPDKGSRRLQFGRHVGEAKLQRLEFVEALSKRLALLHVGQRFLQRALRAAERTAAILMRPPSSPAIAILKPMPSSPSRFSTGTRAFSKITARVGCAFQPILRSLAPNDTPGVLPSMTSVENAAGPVAAGPHHRHQQIGAAGA
jgi:hypothetical protein